MYKKILIIILSFFILASLATPVLAQTENKLKGNECLYENSVVTMSCIMPLFANAVYWLFIMSGVVAVFFIVYGGIKYLTSSGEAKAVESARKVITWAIIGLVVILSSFMIVNIIADLTGVSCITEFGFTACEDYTEPAPACNDCVQYATECRTKGKFIGDGRSCPSTYPYCCVNDR